MRNILYEKLPYIGMTIKKISDSPRISYAGFVFLGTYLVKNGESMLIDIKWQNSKTREILNQEQFINRFLTC